MYLEDIFTVQANLAGVPAISIPMGNSSKNLPMGLQIMAGDFREGAMFSLAKSLEK